MSGELIKIEKPPEPKENPLIVDMVKYDLGIVDALRKTENPEYLYWTDIKRKDWVPNGLTPAEFWIFVKQHRYTSSRLSPIKDVYNFPFKWKQCSHYNYILHEIDLNMGGRLLGLDSIPEYERHQYVSNQLMEEAIASAQLEGAHTSREQAKKMIQEGRTPTDNSQRMIYNNYKAVQYIEETLKDRKLDEQALFDLHKMLTRDTLEKPDQSGRYRLPEEDIKVWSPEGKIAHIPPHMNFVKDEMNWLIKWANNDNIDKDHFTHPLIKAIILHFWIGYLHPFADGNGRMARALFYWYLLHKGYWAFAYIPVSTRIKRSPKQYAWSYIYSEQDDNDLTYFIDYNMRQIQYARKDFENYLAEKIEESKDKSHLYHAFPDLNNRQIDLIAFLRSHPKGRTNVTSLSRIHGITPATAVKDLKIMEEKGLLSKKRLGRNVFYYPTDPLLSTKADDK